MKLARGHCNSERTRTTHWFVALYSVAVESGDEAERTYRKGASTPCRLNPQTLLSAFFGHAHFAANPAQGAHLRANTAL